MLALRWNAVRGATDRLVQDPCHAFNKELEVLWTVQTSEEMPEEVLRRRPVASLGYGVQNQHQEQLQAVCNEDLSLVLENNVVVRYAPCGRVVL
jgi:hypothetical protein